MQGGALYAGIGVAFGAFVVGALRYELDFPLRVGAMLVPPILLAGAGLTLLLQQEFGLRPLQALGVLAAGLIALVILYELVPSPRERRAKQRRAGRRWK